MASGEAFVRNYANALELKETEEKIAIVMTLVGLARTLWRMWGKQATEACIRQLAGDKGVDPDEVFSKVDWQEVQSLDDSGSSRGIRKHLGVEEIRLTPATTPEQQPAAASSTPAMGQFGHVAKEKQKHDDQVYHKIVLASMQFGKVQVMQQQEQQSQEEDPLQTNDPYAQGMTDEQRMRAQLATTNAQLATKDETIRQLQDRLTKLETIIIGKQTGDATLVFTNIATPTTPKKDYQLLTRDDFKAIRYGDRPEDKTMIKRSIIAGSIYDPPRSPSGGGTPYSPEATGSIYQLGGGGGPPGGDGGGEDDEGVNGDDNNWNGGRHGRDYREFSLVSPNKVVVPILSGINLQNKPYMPFNKAVRRLIQTQGPRGVVLLSILDDVETYGAEPHDDDKLQRLIALNPRAREYNIAIQNVVENYTTDIAEGLIKYGVHNGFDAWRKLFHHYVPPRGGPTTIINTGALRYKAS